MSLSCAGLLRHLALYCFVSGVKTFLVELFIVEFVRTTYTVLETAGSFEVCVNLSRPVKDVLDETVVVSIIDNRNSSAIPPDALFASKFPL